MSSKFQGPRIRFKTPAVCKKAIPPPGVVTFPTVSLNAWFTFQGHDGAGNPIHVIDIASLTYSFAVTHRWTAQYRIEPWRISLILIWNEPANAWAWQQQGIDASFDFWEAELAAWHPWQLDPFETGHLNLTIVEGSGEAAARILL